MTKENKKNIFDARRNQLSSLHLKWEAARRAGLSAEGWHTLFDSECRESVIAASDVTREVANLAIRLNKNEMCLWTRKQNPAQLKQMLTELSDHANQAVDRWSEAAASSSTNSADSLMRIQRALNATNAAAELTSYITNIQCHEARRLQPIAVTNLFLGESNAK
jgi:hypothetical protein